MLEKIKYDLVNRAADKIRAVCAVILAAAIAAGCALLIDLVNTVCVSDGNSIYLTHTLQKSIPGALKNLGLSENYELVSVQRVARRTNVQIAYTFPVYVTSGSKTVEIELSGGTVEDALHRAGYSPDAYDLVEPALSTEITGTVYIDYWDVDYVSDTKEESIPCGLNTVYSDELAQGESRLIPGLDGKRVLTLSSKYVNGKLVDSSILGEEILIAPVDSVRLVGAPAKSAQAEQTAAKPEQTAAVQPQTNTISSASVPCVSTLTPEEDILLDESGVPVSYRSKSVVRATAYTYTGHNCATGVAPQPGYIAVNPSVIPYGTRLYIRSEDGGFVYGYAIAADTGGFIRNHPTGIDLFMSTVSACKQFGVRNVEVYILE